MKRMVSRLIRRMAESEALVRPLTLVADALGGSRGCLLTFHRAAPCALWETLPNRDFYLDLDFLDRFLAHLKMRGWEVVTIEEALRRAALGRVDDRYVNFSVDDCYRDTFEQVVPLFRRHGVPVTLFVTTGIPDGTLPLWAAGLEDVLLRNDRVALADKTISVPTADSKRAAFAEVAAQWDGPEAGDHYAKFCAMNGVDREAMHWKHAISWSMLETLRDDLLVEIGAHTVTHPRVSSLSAQDALNELQGSRERLMSRLHVTSRHFAFPFGRAADCGARDFDIARQAGFTSAATTRKGLVRRGQEAFALPRNTINGGHRNLAVMDLHLSGVTGAAARLSGRV